MTTNQWWLVLFKFQLYKFNSRYFRRFFINIKHYWKATSTGMIKMTLYMNSTIFTDIDPRDTLHVIRKQRIPLCFPVCTTFAIKISCLTIPPAVTHTPLSIDFLSDVLYSTFPFSRLNKASVYNIHFKVHFCDLLAVSVSVRTLFSFVWDVRRPLFWS